MSNYLADGIGGSLGDSLALEAGFIGIGTSTVWYVSSVSGTDSAGYGRNRDKPYATLAYAITNATAEDTIVALSNHVEDSTALVDVNKALVIVGEGSSGGYPTAVWGHDMLGSDEVITISAANVEIRNIKFTACQQAYSSPRIKWTGAGGKMRGCLLQAGENDDDVILEVDGDRMTLESNTFISTATTTATAPAQAIRTNTSGLTMLKAIGNVISGGSSGWSSANGAFYIRQGASLTVRIEAMSLLLGADILLTSGGIGFVSVPTSTGGAQVREV